MSKKTSHIITLFALSQLVLLLLISFAPNTSAKTPPIDYKSEHSNYGDFQKFAQYAREHIQPPDATSDQKPFLKSTAEEDLYYFFSLYDRNRDSHLDGHELRTAFTQAGQMPPPESRLTLKDVEEMVDHALEEDDRNGDGKISWEEYLASQLYHEG